MESEKTNQPNVALIIAVIVVAAVALYILLVMPGTGGNGVPTGTTTPPSEEPFGSVESRNWLTEDEQDALDDVFRQIELDLHGDGTPGMSDDAL